ncbi:MAG: ligand-binding sensor domain-containing protein, partial [Candidatus Angelobacter sp.]
MKRILLLSGFWLCLAGAAWCLDPHKPITQYVHTVWRSEDGLPQNSIQALLQTRDGYLWIGTQEGLVRFNGVEFKVFNKSTTPAIRHNDVRALYQDRDGALWVGTFGGGLVR